MAIAAMIISFVMVTPIHAQSEADCAARADRAARDSGRVVGGAVVGAASGAAIGAIVSNKSRSVRRGAAIGTVVGGTAGAHRNNQTYKRVYDDCMAGRYR
jgi:uncharacterized membrane protein